MTTPNNPRPLPGEMVILIGLPIRFLDDLPSEDQEAISAVLGKPVHLSGYDEDGRAELEFTDSEGNGHTIWVTPNFIKSSEKA